MCSANGRAKQPSGALDATVAKGVVMEEVRIQVSAEHRTRIRLWHSSDPAVGCRLELVKRPAVRYESCGFGLFFACVADL